MTNAPSPSETTLDQDIEPGNLSLLEHLNELRIRLTYIVVALLVTTAFSFVFAEPMLQYLLGPYAASVDGVVELLQETVGATY